MMAGTSLMVLLAGIIGTDFAPSEGMATLPIALVVVGVAASTLPTGRLMERFGRRPVFVVYGLVAIVASLLAMTGLVYRNFLLFCAAALMMGWAGAAGHQYRFAALEAVPASRAPGATSILLLGGILAAFIGPEIAVRGRALLPTEYAGSFLLLSISYLFGLVLVSFHKENSTGHRKPEYKGRSMLAILRSPLLLLAITAAALGYGIMSFIMTATPISMHLHSGHSLESTKLVIQSHIAAMYLPALVYPWLQARTGFRGMLWLGISAYLVCLSVAAVDTGFLNYWLALVLLGIGWNFLFLTGTNLLPFAYNSEERYRVQSLNDFLVFSVQALASLSAGWFLFIFKWHWMIFACFPVIGAFVFFLWMRGNVIRDIDSRKGSTQNTRA